MNRILHLCVLIGTLVLFAACGGNEGQPATAAGQSANTANDTAAVKSIVFFGNSLSAGYGLSPSEAFPAVIQQKIDSAGLQYKVVNAGVSGETTAGGVSRIDWILQQPVDVFVLELGGNDGLRGVPVAQTESNLQTIIDRVKAKYPSAKIVLAGMQVPPNMGKDYAEAFRSVYPKLAAQNKITLVPFLLEGVGGEAKLNQADGIHPTAEGARMVAQNVWQVLQPLL